MAYRDFTLEEAEQRLGLTATNQPLFPGLEPATVPLWLPAQIERNLRLTPLSTEKARSECVVLPVLSALEELGPKPLAIFSGQRLDVDPDRGLVGEFDFLLARTLPLPRVRAPLVAVAEAKRGDVEAGIGQCLAQMVAAQVFNERAGSPRSVWGCVTSGEEWQFLRLDGSVYGYEPRRFARVELGHILAALVRCVSDLPATGPAPAAA